MQAPPTLYESLAVSDILLLVKFSDRSMTVRPVIPHEWGLLSLMSSSWILPLQWWPTGFDDIGNKSAEGVKNKKHAFSLCSWLPDKLDPLQYKPPHLSTLYWGLIFEGLLPLIIAKAGRTSPTRIPTWVLWIPVNTTYPLLQCQNSSSSVGKSLWQNLEDLASNPCSVSMSFFLYCFCWSGTL